MTLIETYITIIIAVISYTAGFLLSKYFDKEEKK